MNKKRKYALLAGIILPFSLSSPIAAATTGEDLMKQSNCFACHSVDKKLFGPSFRDIAKKYSKNPKAVELLTERVIKGSKGIWGKLPMAPQSQLKPADVKKMVEWILTNTNEEKTSSASKIEGAFHADTASVSVGKALFSGSKRFTNGGPSCISCHHVKGTGRFGGGELAIELTETFSKFGPDTLLTALESPGFPVMNEIYSTRPITKEEAGHLVSFLSTLEGEAPGGNKSLEFLAGGIAFFLFFLLLMHFAWINRKKLTRKILVEEN